MTWLGLDKTRCDQKDGRSSGNLEPATIHKYFNQLHTTSMLKQSVSHKKHQGPFSPIFLLTNL